MIYSGLIFVILLGLFFGYIAYRLIDALTEKTHCNLFAARFFSSSLIQLIYTVALIGIYLLFGFSVEFLLYAGFSLILLIVTYTDLLETTIDLWAIILGIIYSLSIQVYLGQGYFALLGGVVSALVSGVFFMAGNRIFSGRATAVPGFIESNSSLSLSSLTLPLAPSIAIAVIIHGLFPSPGGLVKTLLQAINYINSHSFVLAGIVCIVVLGIFRVYYLTKREVEVDSPAETEDMPALGDGDIILSIFIGVVLGWQNYIAILWVGMVIHSIIGLAILLKFNSSSHLHD